MAQSDPPRRILISRTDRIGDVVLTTPLATALKAALPDSEITFLIRDYTAPLVALHRDVDHIRIYDPAGRHRGLVGHLRLTHELRREGYDTVILARPRPALAAVLFLAGIARRIGIGYRWYSIFLNHRIFEHRKTGQRHELDHNLTFLQALGIAVPGDVRFHFELTDALRQWRQEEWARRGLSGPYALIHPGSGGSAPNLTDRQYRLLIETLLEETDMTVLLTGAASEKRLAAQLVDGFPAKRVRSLAGAFDMAHLMAVIAEAELFMASSTGPFHIANAFDVPVLGFYCPAPPCSPRRWGPYHQQEWVLVPDLPPCEQCRTERCPHGNCLSHLSDDRLRDTLRRRLADMAATREAAP